MDRRNCPSRKPRFYDELSARIAVLKIESYANRNPSGDDWEPQRAYRCNLCGYWHLTTQEKRT